jgi:hypothetical protein
MADRRPPHATQPVATSTMLSVYLYKNWLAPLDDLIGLPP